MDTTNLKSHVLDSIPEFKREKDKFENLCTEKAVRYFFEDENAVQLLLDIWLVIQAWDDAHDNDLTGNELAYKKAMIDLPNNPLYQVCSVPFLISQLYVDWCAANEFEEKKDKHNLPKAFMLRAGFYRVMTTLIGILEGQDAAAEKAPQVWRCYGEIYEEYEEEILCQPQQARY